MIGAKVDVRKGWGVELARKVNAEIPAKLERAAEAGAREASQRSLARTRSGDMATMTTLEVRGTGDGWLGGFASAAWYARLHSKGYNAGGVTPVPGLKFLEAGRTVARRALVDELNRL